MNFSSKIFSLLREIFVSEVSKLFFHTFRLLNCCLYGPDDVQEYNFNLKTNFLNDSLKKVHLLKIWQEFISFFTKFFIYLPFNKSFKGFIHLPKGKCVVFGSHQDKWFLNVSDWNITFFVQIVKKSSKNLNFSLKCAILFMDLLNFLGFPS